MNKKGIEGLPLKYVVVALVGALVIGIAVQMTNTIQTSVEDSTSVISEQTTGLVIDAARGNTYVTGFENVGVLSWSFNATTGDLKVALVNTGVTALDIDYINASFNGITDTSNTDRTLQPGESTRQLTFGLSSLASNGDQISVSLVVVKTDASVERGILVGVAQ
ncbi:hypothetical protein COT72_03115 [archaeon CG10_big_fil_rev_8_21_14_0_10_43_11]|nr:MAG: hypothetical protein COT72_03115 [archaeon CG10_big_fil_rev_8_21_14_0_10_43_11]